MEGWEQVRYASAKGVFGDSLTSDTSRASKKRDDASFFSARTASGTATVSITVDEGEAVAAIFRDQAAQLEAAARGMAGGKIDRAWLDRVAYETADIYVLNVHTAGMSRSERFDLSEALADMIAESPLIVVRQRMTVAVR